MKAALNFDAADCVGFIGISFATLNLIILNFQIFSSTEAKSEWDFARLIARLVSAFYIKIQVTFSSK